MKIKFLLLLYFCTYFLIAKAQVYTISYNSLGGSTVVNSITKPDTTIAPPVSPTKAGYTFEGWFKESQCINRWLFAYYKVVSNITLYANWVPTVNSNINVPNAGSFKTALYSAAYNRNSVTNLTVTGNIDARDICFMRDSMPVLAVLDLSGAQINAYSGIGGTFPFFSVSYPANEMPEYSFYNANTVNTFGKKTLTHVIMPTNISSIGSNAFADCSFLSGKLMIPQSVTIIHSYAFMDCRSYTDTLDIPNSVKTIESHAFANCNGFSALHIPVSVKSIGIWAFFDCASLNLIKVDIPNPISIDSSVFIWVNKYTCKLIVPNGSESKYQNSLVWKDFYHLTGNGFVVSFNSDGGSLISSIVVAPKFNY